MTFTWDPSDLSTALSQVRQTIGDIASTDPLLTDEQIAWRLGQYSQAVQPASIRCVHDIIAKLARDVDRSNVGMSATRSQKITHYKDLLEKLQGENRALAEMSVGGLSESAAATVNSDSDYRKVRMWLGWGKNTTQSNPDPCCGGDCSG
jgi:hypothetical protein